MDTADSTEQRPRVFVVDDDISVRDSVGRLLGSEGLVVEGFGSAATFLDAFDRGRGPSCVVLDVFLPGLSGLGLQERLLRLESPPAVIFLTGRGDIPMSVRALKQGALEFFTKPFVPADLVGAVRAAIARARVAEVRRQHLAELMRRHRSLTARERDVMEGVLAGLLNKQIAAKFGTSEVTVKEQRASVMRKMCAKSAADLIRMGVELGVVAVEGGGGVE